VETGSNGAFITLIGTLIGLSVGIWRFGAQQAQANKGPFLQKQLELCFEATEIVGRLASEIDAEEWEKLRLSFWRLYWGPLSIVEDREVEAAMVKLGRLVPKQPVSQAELPMRSLEGLSYELAHAVRALILDSWNVDLQPLRGQRAPS
jgi:hypothetical protein